MLSFIQERYLLSLKSPFYAKQDLKQGNVIEIKLGKRSNQPFPKYFTFSIVILFSDINHFAAEEEEMMVQERRSNRSENKIKITDKSPVEMDD